MKLDNFLQKLISWLFAGMFFLAPLFFTSVNSELFEFNKIILVYAWTTLIAGAWIARMFLQKKIIFKRSFFDIPLILFLVSQTLSTIFSIDPHTSIFGYYSRFNGSLLSTLCYLLLYWAFVSNCEAKDVHRSVKFSLISGAIISVYGILEHFGHSFSCLIFLGNFDVSCWVQKVQERVFATLGQPNWLAAYLATLIPLTFLCHSRVPPQRDPANGGKSGNLYNKNLFYRFRISLRSSGMTILLFSLFFACLLFTQSRSGFLGFVLSFVVFWVLSFRASGTSRGIPFPVKPFIILNSLILILVIMFGSPFPQINKYFYYKSFVSRVSTHNPPSQPDSPLPSDDGGISASSDIRKIVWKGAFDIFKHYPLFGSGVETFAYSYYNFRPVEHNYVSEWDFLYNKAHNEYLNYLSTTGIFGLGSYLIFIGSFVLYILLSFPRKRESTQKENSYRFQVKPGMTNKNFNLCTLIFALFAGWLSLLVTNFFGFSVVVTSLYFFLIPAFVVVLLSPSTSYNLIPNPSSKSLNPHIPKSLLLVPLLLIFYILYLISKMWLADYHYNLGLKLGKLGKTYESYQNFHQAFRLNKNEPVIISETSVAVSNLALIAWQQKDASTAGELSDLAAQYSDKAKNISPVNLNILKARIKVFYTLSQIKPDYLNETIKTAEEAVKLAPTDPKLLYNLGLFYGKNGEGKKAIETIEKAVQLKSNYYDARNALAVFYEDIGETDKSLEQLDYLLKLASTENKPEIQKRIDKLK